MDHAEKDLLKQAFWQAFEEKQSEELAASEPAFRPSAYHLRRVSRILGIDVQREADRRYYLKKRVVTLILAAAMLLATILTVYAYRNVLWGFWEEVFEDHNEVGFWEIPADAPAMIEEVYELGYVPEGYVETNRVLTEFGSNYYYANGRGQTLGFNQYILYDYVSNIDNEYGDTGAKKLGGREVYYYISDQTQIYLWSDGIYVLKLFVSTLIEEEEVLKMMDGIQIKK